MSQNDSTTSQPPYGGPRTGLSGRGGRFFAWMRSLGIVRSDGWAGGVCAGVAYRLGIDPLIVRGIVVVAAILGAPAVLIYALAWALLPDRDGRIHLERLFEGDIEAPIVAIGVLLIFSLLPWSSGIGWFGGGFWDNGGWAHAVGQVFWTLLVLGLVTGLIVLAVRAADRRPAGPAHDTPAPAPGSDPGTAGAATANTTLANNAAHTSTARDDEGAPTDAEALPATPGAPTPPLDITSEPVAPPAPSAGASHRDMVDWRRRQAEWKADHARWKARLAEDMRTVSAQRTAELRSQAAAASAEASARRAAYRAANPRVGAALSWLTLGLALIAGATVSALWVPLTGSTGYAAAAALAAATLIFGVAALIAGLARRRSGFFITFGIILAVITALTAALPGGARAGFSTSTVVGANQTLSPAADAAYVQGWGATTIDLADAVTAPGTPEIDLAKGSDPTTVLVPADATVRIEAATTSTVTVVDPSGAEQTQRCQPRPLGGCSANILVGPGGTPNAIVRIAQIDHILVQREQK